MKIYMDNAATTVVEKEVIDEMIPYFSEKFYNCSSLYASAVANHDVLDDCRQRIASLVGADAEEIVFTSGGSESDNLALKGVALSFGKGHIVTSKIEHPAVLEVCKFLEKKGFEVSYIDVGADGIVSVDAVKEAIRDDTILVSIMHVNNEIGTIQPVEEIGTVCKEKGILFHTDAVQGFGKIKFDLDNIDMFSVSGHKIHGPKGIGFLYVKKGVKLEKQIHGGNHELNKRAGTENLPLIVGLVKASELCFNSIDETNAKILEMRERLIDGLLEIDRSYLNGDREKRIAANVNVRYDLIEGEGLLLTLDSKGIMCSTGSACSSHSLEPSHVLMALGLKAEESHGSLRFTLSKHNTMEEVEYVIKEVKEAVAKLRELSPMK